MAFKDDEQRKAYQRAYYQAHKDTKKRGKTSSEAKQRYNEKTYQRYTLVLKKIEDADLIAKIDLLVTQGLSQSEAIKTLLSEQ